MSYATNKTVDTNNRNKKQSHKNINNKKGISRERQRQSHRAREEERESNRAGQTASARCTFNSRQSASNQYWSSTFAGCVLCDDYVQHTEHDEEYTLRSLKTAELLAVV